MNKNFVLILGSISLMVFVLLMSGCNTTAGKAYATVSNQTNSTNQTGSLFVASSPTGANLYVDNILKGTTPRTVTGLTIGNHAIKVAKSGYNDYSTKSYIYAGQTVNLSVILTPVQNNQTNSTNQTNNVTHMVCSGNSCISVLGAGINQCTSNAQCASNQSNNTNATHNICSGNSCISVLGAGINQCTSNAQCAYNQTNQTNQTGSLFVASIPSNASLYIDNSYRGITPYTVSGLIVGNHAVKLTKSGYYDYTTTKYIYAGSNLLNVTLTHVQNNQTNSLYTR